PVLGKRAPPGSPCIFSKHQVAKSSRLRKTSGRFATVYEPAQYVFILPTSRFAPFVATLREISGKSALWKAQPTFWPLSNPVLSKAAIMYYRAYWPLLTV